MPEIKELFQSADWKKEKHVPAIESPDILKKGAFSTITITVGKEIAHPNTTEHHIRWICVYFLPDGEKFAYEVGKTEFNAHGESSLGPNTSTIFTNPSACFSFKSDKPGALIAASYCNIHGLWQNSKQITVE